MIHVDILRYRSAKYLWWALLAVALSSGLYLTQGGAEPPNGGTWQGYVLGTVGALLIVWLSLLGVRKRRYASTIGSVQGWTSAHVYLGGTLLVIATLHSGGQLGMNIHSVAYVLTVVVVLSGIYGIYAYLTFPRAINETRGGASRSALFAELYELDKRARELSSRGPDDIGLAVQSAIERTVVGGGLAAQLFGRDQSRYIPASASASSGERKPVGNADQQPVIDLLASRIPSTTKIAEAELLQELLAIFCRRQAVLRRIASDIRLSGWLKIWLYLHIPLSVALIVAILLHIVTTFVYW